MLNAKLSIVYPAAMGSKMLVINANKISSILSQETQLSAYVKLHFMLMKKVFVDALQENISQDPINVHLVKLITVSNALIMEQFALNVNQLIYLKEMNALAYPSKAL